MAPEKSHAWTGIAEQPEFRQLLISKARFIVPATVFFIVYYFALPVTVGYFPQLMSRKVWRSVNLAYVFALSQFVMAWVIAALYVRAAARFDRQAHDLVGHLSAGTTDTRAADGTPAPQENNGVRS